MRTRLGGVGCRSKRGEEQAGQTEQADPRPARPKDYSPWGGLRRAAGSGRAATAGQEVVP